MILLFWQRIIKGDARFCATSLQPFHILAATCLLSLGVCAYLSSAQPTLAYYVLPSRFWQLMAGAILNVAMEQLDAEKESHAIGALGSVAMELAAVVLLALAFAITPNSMGFPFPWSLLGIGGALAAIAAGGLPRRHLACGVHTPLLGRILALQPIVYVGKLSYPLYLWHWPTLVLFRWTGERTHEAHRLLRLLCGEAHAHTSSELLFAHSASRLHPQHAVGAHRHSCRGCPAVRDSGGVLPVRCCDAHPQCTRCCCLQGA